MKILIKYGNGTEEACDTGHESEEAFVNEKFGSAYQAFLDGGGEIVLASTEPTSEELEAAAKAEAEAAAKAEAEAAAKAEAEAAAKAEADKTGSNEL